MLKNFQRRKFFKYNQNFFFSIELIEFFELFKVLFYFSVFKVNYKVFKERIRSNEIKFNRNLSVSYFLYIFQLKAKCLS